MLIEHISVNKALWQIYGHNFIFEVDICCYVVFNVMVNERK